MKTLLVLCMAGPLLLSGCAAFQEPQAETASLQLLDIKPLPPLRSPAHISGVNMAVLIHVMKDGSISFARMMGTTGDPEWDSLAVMSIREWRFAPPMRDGAPADVWARQLVVVQVQDPVSMMLSERTFPTGAEADSVYALLEGGADSRSVFVAPPRLVDITTFPGRIRDALKGLGVGDWSRPVQVKEGYRIFKRFPRTPGAETPGA